MGSHRLIYLAYPVDFVQRGSTPELDSVLNQVKLEIELHRVGCYDPGAAVRTGVLSVGDEVHKIHHRAQSLCTATIALLPPNVPTVGVPVEIYKAASGWGMPTVVIGGDGSWSLPAGVGQRPWPDGIDDIRFQVDMAVKWLLEQPAAYYGDRGTSELPFGRLPATSSAQLPTRAYPDDAGLDLYVSERVVVPPGQFVDVSSGVAVQLPDYAWGYLTGRSSTLRRKGLLVNPAVIDAGYRGELYAGVWNLTGEAVTVEQGERIAQLIILNNETRYHLPVWGELAAHDRGDQGFGSSGV